MGQFAIQFGAHFPERRDDDHQHRGCVDDRLDRIFAVKLRVCAAPLRGLGA